MCKNRDKPMFCRFCGEKYGFFLEVIQRKNGEIGFFHPICGTGTKGLRYDRTNDSHWWEGEDWGEFGKENGVKKEEKKKNEIEEEKTIEKNGFGLEEEKNEVGKEEKGQELEINISVGGRKLRKRKKR